MVARGRLLAPGLLALAALPVLAQSPRDEMFPGLSVCYAREYDRAHLAAHPDQRVTSVALTPDQAAPTDALFPLWVVVTHRDQPGKLEALAYCENIEDTLYCGMEGDAGAFSIAPAREGAVLLSVARGGMGFEGETGFVRLEADRGDDRTFLLYPARDCR